MKTEQSQVRCVDQDENPYNLTKFVCKNRIETTNGVSYLPGAVEYYFHGKLVTLRPDGSFEIMVGGALILVKEIDAS